MKGVSPLYRYVVYVRWWCFCRYRDKRSCNVERKAKGWGINVLGEGGGLKRDASSCLSWMRTEAGKEPDYRRNKDTGPLQYAAKLPFTSDTLTTNNTARLSFFHSTCVTVCMTHAARLHVKSAAWAFGWNEGVFRKESGVWLRRFLWVLMLWRRSGRQCHRSGTPFRGQARARSNNTRLYYSNVPVFCCCCCCFFLPCLV